MTIPAGVPDSQKIVCVIDGIAVIMTAKECDTNGGEIHDYDTSTPAGAAVAAVTTPPHTRAQVRAVAGNKSHIVRSAFNPHILPPVQMSPSPTIATCGVKIPDPTDPTDPSLAKRPVITQI